MKKSTLRSEIFTVYLEKAAAFSAGLSFNIGIAKILILFSNFLDWVAGIGPMSAWPHIGQAPKPHSSHLVHIEPN